MSEEWWEHGYEGGPMVPVKGFPRPLYPPDASKHGKQPSKDGPDVLAYKRTVCRAGRWGEWDPNLWDEAYSNNFAHGRGGNVKDTGIAGVQRQQHIDDSGWLGEKTFNTLRSIRVPEGPHRGEMAMDAYAADLINQAWDRFKGQPDTRCKLSEHFIVEEFDCHDGTPVQSRDYDGLKKLCSSYLEPLHDEYGPVNINSGFRTQSYNASIGGASNSFHVYTAHDGNDQACDIACAHGTPSQWHSFLNHIRQQKFHGNGGLGLYSTFVHVDMRDYPSSWSG